MFFDPGGLRSALLFPAGLLSLLGGCGGATDVSGTDGGARHGNDASGVDGGARHDSGPREVPIYHRPSDSECMTVPEAGNCAFPSYLGDTCGSPGSGSGSTGSGSGDTDSQCTAGSNGRCISLQGPAGCDCTYDSCASDSECPANELCVCHGSAFTDGAGNTCTAGNCRVDSDCGDGGYCSPSETGACGNVGGYYCHTAADACLNDSDCSSDGEDACVWSASDSHWECQPLNLCG